MRVVLDSNVVVDAGFDDASDAAAILAAIRASRIGLVWDEVTRDETCKVVRNLERLDWAKLCDIYCESCVYRGPTHPDRFGAVSDPPDRAFAALAAAAGAVLVSSDGDLVGVREKLGGVTVMTPAEFAERHVAKADQT